MKRRRRMILDAVIAVVTIAIFFICKRLWLCDYDMSMSVFGVIVVIAGTIMLEIQNRKIDK